MMQYSPDKAVSGEPGYLLKLTLKYLLCWLSTAN